MEGLKPGDRVQSFYMDWKVGNVVADKRGKFRKVSASKSGPRALILVQMTDWQVPVYWDERDLMLVKEAE